jgi:hypothetical protein
MGAITVRARVLEQFLAKVLQTVGVPILYAYEFVAHCPASAAASGRALFHATTGVPAAHYAHPRANDSALFWCSRPLSALTRRFHARTPDPRDSTSAAAFLALDFDVLVGADGTQSRVRQFSRVPYRQQNSFLLGHHHATLPDLHQTTLILNFAPTTPPPPPPAAAAAKASSRYAPPPLRPPRTGSISGWLLWPALRWARHRNQAQSVHGSMRGWARTLPGWP